MKTLRNASDREEILRRLRSVTPEQSRLWGTMDAPRMLCHVSDALRVAVGDMSAAPAGNFLTHTLLRWLVVDTAMKAPPGKVMTAPVMLTTRPTDWSADIAACEALIMRVGNGEASSPHPSFGSLDADAWGRLSWKHLDHHLRQFGA